VSKHALLFAVAVVLVLLSKTLATNAASDAPRRTAELVCTMSAFFSVDRAEQTKKSSQLDGRGLVSCKTDQGFNTEFPVRVDLRANLPEELFEREGEIAFSANSAPFVVAHETAMTGERLENRPYSWLASDGSPEERTLFFRGDRSDISIELKLASRGVPLSGANFTSLQLRSDDEAPDLF
jgi:hypothetical protein